MQIGTTDSCYGQPLHEYSPWIYKAPFKVNYETKTLNVDLSNTLPMNTYGTLRDIGPIQLGIFIASASESCVSPLSDLIPYLEENWLQSTSGIVSVPLRDDQLKDIRSFKLVMYQEMNDVYSDVVPFCGDVFQSTKGSHSAQLLIEEPQYYVRPLDLYVGRLEYGESQDMTLLVTERGFPVENVPIVLKRSNPDVVPEDGLVPEKWSVTTDNRGHTVFTFNAAQPIPYPRVYTEPPCPGTNDFSLPIDGQIYLYKYCIESECPPDIQYLFVPELSFLVFSTVKYSEPYTWVNDVQPIFSQYYYLNRAMAVVLNLSDYHSVTNPGNTHLIKLAMSQDFNDPNFMPVTRDLSPTKTRMILHWLDNPIFSTDNESPPEQNNGRSTCSFIDSAPSDHTPSSSHVLSQVPVGVYFCNKPSG